MQFRTQLRYRWMTAAALALVLLLVGGLVSNVNTATAQADPTWEGEYFNNPYFLGSSEFRRQDNEISFYWGDGAPRNLRPENYSVRWGTDVFLPAGTYRFYALVDDEVRIAVDYGSYFLNTFGAGRAGTLVTEDIYLEAGTHHIQVDYREFSGAAYANVSFESLEDGAQGPDFNVNQPGTPGDPGQPGLQPEGNWTAFFYPNANLAGNPDVVRLESDPDNNWGAGSPAATIPVDNWSGRWTRNLNLAGGTYRVSAQADDGVRVYVNDSLVINEWHVASGQTYTAEFSLAPGVHRFTVEYYEGTGLASLSFDLTQISQGGGVAPGYATATVAVSQLNVRSVPDTFTGSLLTTVTAGRTYPVTGRTADFNWVRVNVDGITGWVNTAYVSLNNAQAVPVVTAAPTPDPVPTRPAEAQPTPYSVTATPYTVNIRTGPGTSFTDIGNLPVGNTAQVIGRNAESTWWQINYRGITGWVSAVYAPIEQGADLSQVPITG